MIRLDVVINVGLSAFLLQVSSLSRFLKLQAVQNLLYESLTFKITPKYRIFVFRGLIFNDIILLIFESLNLALFWMIHLKIVSILLFECISVKGWESMSSPKWSIIHPPFWFLSDFCQKLLVFFHIVTIAFWILCFCLFRSKKILDCMYELTLLDTI